VSGFADHVYEAGVFALDSVAHGEAAGAVTPNSAVLEFSHPLDSGDPQDFDIDEADRVGVCLIAGIGGLADEVTEPEACNLAITQQRSYAELRLP
jgi:hypothetical protein